jgi:hypothetical protein
MTVVVSLAALASEQRRMHVEIEIDDDGGAAQAFSFNSDQAGFDLQQMQVGESQTITDASGNAALVTRTEAGFQFDVDGKTIDIPDHKSAHGLIVIDEVEDVDTDVRVMKEVRKIKIMESGEDVVLIGADSSHDDHGIHSEEEHEVIIIKKEIDVAN